MYVWIYYISSIKIYKIYEILYLILGQNNLKIFRKYVTTLSLLKFIIFEFNYVLLCNTIIILAFSCIH